LVAVAKIDAAPHGGFIDNIVWPSPVGQIDDRVGLVLAYWRFLHGGIVIKITNGWVGWRRNTKGLAS